MYAVVENKMFEIETMQFPKKGKYSNQLINGKDVIVASPANIEILQDFLYGDN